MANKPGDELSFTKEEWQVIAQALATQVKVHERAAKAETDAEIADAHRRRVARVSALHAKVSNLPLL